MSRWPSLLSLSKIDENHMADDKDFQTKIQRIGELVGELENIR